MGDVPINPSGFAHGFRPLDGADNPPPTPTQRNVTQGDVGVPGGGFLSALSQQTPGDAAAGAMGIGLGSSRKRRRFPGPLALLQQGHSGGMGQQQSGGGSDDDNQQRLSDDSDRDEGEAGGGHFRKGPWLSLCSAVDAPIPEEGDSDSKAVQTFLRSAVSPMSEILAGDFDLRVPVVTAVIDSYTQLSVSDVIVELVDPSGRIKGYLHPGCLEEHGPLLGPGAALLLKEVSIFVSGPDTTRLLNVHPDCILAVFPADTPLPTPSRLEWLTNCDPPFTPRPVSDHGSTPPPPSRRTPPPPTTPAASSAARPVGAASRRRPRPLAARGDDAEQQSSPNRSQQWGTTPRISPPAPRPLAPPQGEREERRQGRREQQQRHQQPRHAPATLDGGSPPAQEGEPRNTSPRRPCPGLQSLPPSPSASPSPGCPSPPGMFSQSQTQQHQQHQIPLGQHSEDEGGGRGGKPEAAASEAGGSVDGIGGCGTSDGTREDGSTPGRGRAGAPAYPGGWRGETRDGVDEQGSCSRQKGGRKDLGVSSAPGSTSTQQEEPVRALGSVDTEGGRGSEGNKFGVAGGPGHSRGTAQPPPGSDADQPTPTEAEQSGRAIGVGGARLLGGGAPAAAASSLWADLDGLASDDDSASDGDQGAARNRLAASESSMVPSLLQGAASSNADAAVDAAAGKTDRGTTAVATDAASTGAERGEVQSLSGGVFPASETERNTAESGGAGFSLLAGAGGTLGDNDLLDAALEDSE